MTAGKTFALITGATSGIGYELARVFAENKFNLVIVARDQAELDNTAIALNREYGIRVETLARDLFIRDQVFDVYQQVKALGIEVEVLVNNAGQGLFGRFSDTDLERELKLLDLNIGAYLVLTKLFLRDMLARGSGKILNVASIASKVPGPYQAVYHGTKAFIHSFNEAVRAEVEGTGVTVTSLLPGATDTDFFNKAHMRSSRMLEHPLSDPAKVAKEGYRALMAGEDMVVPGIRWRAQVAASNFTPDRTLAKIMLKQQEPRH